MKCFCRNITSSFSASIALASLLFLGSCSSFHTPISRQNFNPGASSAPSAPAVRSNSSNGVVHFHWPVDRARMTRGFLPNQKRPHYGLDLAAPKGTPILAAHSGLVIYTGQEFSGYGKMVMIESGNGWASLYAHFDRILVSQGQKVRAGEIIGEMGRTGRATGVHLHFEIRKDRAPVDPLPLLPRALAHN